MELSYDPRYNVAYLRFHEKQSCVETLQISESILIDMAPDGSVYGIELLNANEQFQWHQEGEFSFINEATGERKKILIPINLTGEKQIQLEVA